MSESYCSNLRIIEGNLVGLGCGSFRTTVNRPSEAGGSPCQSAIPRDRVWSRHERKSFNTYERHVPWETPLEQAGKG